MQDGVPKALDEIGRMYGVTRERIRQIEKKTMDKRRHPTRRNPARIFGLKPDARCGHPADEEDTFSVA